MGQTRGSALLHALSLALWTGPPTVRGQDIFLPSAAFRPGGAQRARPTRPNMVWILTDDQDQALGASFPQTTQATPMPKTKKLLQDQGAHATNWHIHTPICSPSRSELLTGRYFHNIKRVGGRGYCSGMHVNYTRVYQRHFVRTLQEEGGYATGLFGKYVNEMPSEAPPGFDAWLANGGGSYIAPRFQTKNIDGLPDGHVHFSNDPGNYTTSVVGNTSIAWIRKVAKQGKPFFAYIAPKAAHEPFNPAPWYRDHWDASWPEQEPRPENWNCSFESRKGHHGNIATEPLISEGAARVITGVFKNRWRTLMSVDDLIADVVAAVEELGLLDTTYFFFSSDHGFQLGQFNIPMDKRHVYEWDTKIHLLARGPGIRPGSILSAPGTQVDIAPTLLGLAGIAAPPDMDGRSVVPFLVGPPGPELLEATRAHLTGLGDLWGYGAGWRKEVFIEYYYCSYNNKCLFRKFPVPGCLPGGYPKRDADCANLANNTDCWCTGLEKPIFDANCYATEDPTNNFIALRQFGEGRERLYAEFQAGDQGKANVDFDRVDFAEMYELEQDPWQMRNLADEPSLEKERGEMHARLREWLRCSGPSCP